MNYVTNPYLLDEYALVSRKTLCFLRPVEYSVIKKVPEERRMSLLNITFYALSWFPLLHSYSSALLGKGKSSELAFVSIHLQVNELTAPLKKCAWIDEPK